jgi:hypothetical protein
MMCMLFSRERFGMSHGFSPSSSIHAPRGVNKGPDIYVSP